MLLLSNLMHPVQVLMFKKHTIPQIFEGQCILRDCFECDKPVTSSVCLLYNVYFWQNPRSQSRDEGGKLQITWENPKELEQYISKLQSAAERLSTENRKLRKWHTDFTDKVISLSPLPQAFNLTLNVHARSIKTNEHGRAVWTGFSFVCVCVLQVVCLMGVDLLRQQQRWKDGLQDLRTGFATLESQVITIQLKHFLAVSDLGHF